MRRRDLIGAAMASASMPGAASAQIFPNRPLRLIVTWPPGGTADILSRQLQPALAAALGQPVVIDNRGGASGAIGTGELVRAPNDGHSFAMVVSTLISMPLMQRQSWDPIRDTTPIILHSRVANILVVHPALPVTSVAELIALAKARPGALSFGSPGIGSAVHISGEMFKLMTGTDMVHVPYRGGGPAIADLAAGSLQLMFGNASSTLPFVRDGRVRAIAVSSAARAAYLPEIPTIAEAGLPGYAIDEWYGCIGPPSMAPAAIARLNAAIGDIITAPAERARLLDMGSEVVGGSPEAFGRMLAEELDKIGRVVRDARIRLE
jgi:tripartite-type tricarboxylate transporter receptor subunit TctC